MSELGVGAWYKNDAGSTLHLIDDFYLFLLIDGKLNGSGDASKNQQDPSINPIVVDAWNLWNHAWAQGHGLP